MFWQRPLGAAEGIPREALVVFEAVHNAYHTNALLLAVAKELFVLGLLLYFLWNRNKSPRHQFFWKGFLLIAIGVAPPVAGLWLRPMELPVWQMYAIGLPFAIAGCVCIVWGEVKGRQHPDAGQ